MDTLRSRWYDREFRIRFLERKGQAFQDFFCDIMGKRYPRDFERVRPHGRYGDEKCDGYLRSQGIVFAVHAPQYWERQGTLERALKKVAQDFHGAVEKWSTEGLRRWVYVHNCLSGLPVPVLRLLTEVGRELPGIAIEHWGYDELHEEFFRLSEHNIADLVGPALTQDDMVALTHHELGQVVAAVAEAAAREPPPPAPASAPASAAGAGPLASDRPSARLTASALSDETKAQLWLGVTGCALVGQHFEGLDPDLADRIGGALERRYRDLQGRGRSPDEVFQGLRDFTAGGGQLPPRQEAAVLALIAYFLRERGILDLPPADYSADIEKYFITVDQAFLEAQRRSQVKTMLGASVGDWPLVAQGLDLKRDLQARLMPLVAAPRDRAALLVILGDPGAGKTTLLRRMGRDLAVLGKPVFELRAAAHAMVDWLPALSRLRRQFRQQPILLIDDIFRHEGIEDILTDPDLGCTILATSRTNEDATRRLPTTNTLERLYAGVFHGGRPAWPHLGTPSAGELAALREHLNWPHLSDGRWREITTMRRGDTIVPAPLLVIMMQLAASTAPGRVTPFDEIISRTVDALRRQHPDTYRAFGVVCAFHRLGFDTPSSILDLLVASGFSRALKADVIDQVSECGARGIIFPGEYRMHHESWRTGHEIIAETAAASDYAHMVEACYEEVIAGAEPGAVEQAIFAGWILGTLAKRAKLSLARRLLERHAHHIDALAAANPEAQIVWARTFDLVGEREKAVGCLAAAEPTTQGKTIEMIGLLEKYGQAERALKMAKGWLARHDEDNFVRTCYLGLVERKDAGQVAAALQGTGEWLARHDEDTYVRTRHLTSLKRWGSQEDKDRWVLSTLKWWQSHDVLSVANVLLLLALDCSDKATRRDIVRLGEERAHSYGVEEGYVLGICASLCESFLSAEEVRQKYTRALARVGQGKRATPFHAQTRLAFGKFLLGQEDYQAAEYELRRACEILPTHTVALDLWAQALAKLGYDSEAERTWRRAIANAKPRAKYCNNLGRFYVEHGRYPEARKAFEDALAAWPQFFWALKELGEVEFLEGNVQAAKRRFAQALTLVPPGERYAQARERIEGRARELFGTVPAADEEGPAT